MPASAEVKTLLGQHAAAHRWHKPEASTLASDLAAAKIAAYIERVVAAAPPLSPAHRERLAALLTGEAA